MNMDRTQKFDKTTPCQGCRNGEELDFPISMAFQPIVDIVTGKPYAFEALVRGPEAQTADSILSRVTPTNRYSFDQRCRVAAIELAAKAGLLDTEARLSINFLPNAVYAPTACIQLTLLAATKHQMPIERLIFEFTENEDMVSPAHISNIVATYKNMGFGTALDDFGAGHSGLNRLAELQPDIIKIDMELIRGIDASMPRRTIVDGIVKICRTLDIQLIAEGIETAGECEALRDLGVRYQQGYFFAQPGLEKLPAINIATEPLA